MLEPRVGLDPPIARAVMTYICLITNLSIFSIHVHIWLVFILFCHCSCKICVQIVAVLEGLRGDAATLSIEQLGSRLRLLLIHMIVLTSPCFVLDGCSSVFLSFPWMLLISIKFWLVDR